MLKSKFPLNLFLPADKMLSDLRRHLKDIFCTKNYFNNKLKPIKL